MACQAEVDRSEEENVSTFIYSWKVDKGSQAGAHDDVLMSDRIKTLQMVNFGCKLLVFVADISLSGGKYNRGVSI